MTLKLYTLLRPVVLAVSLTAAALRPVAAQTPTAPPLAAPDTLHKFQDPTSVAAPRQPWYQSKLFKATIVPAILIGYGASTINDRGWYSSYDAQRDIQRNFPNFHTRVDDFLIIAPYFELGAVALFGVESQHDRLNTVLLIAKSEIIFAVLTTTLKRTTRVLRPDGTTRNSFPSGHTAQAFLAASIVHNEFRDRSQWYGIGAYTIATSVAALRMLNNRHWQSDVVAGAGVGILSAHLAYLSHRNRWGRPARLPKGVASLTFSPTYAYGATGVGMTMMLK